MIAAETSTMRVVASAASYCASSAAFRSRSGFERHSSRERRDVTSPLVPASPFSRDSTAAIHATKVAGSGGAGQRWVSFPSRAIRPYVCASYAFFNWSSDGGYTSNQSNPYTLSRDSFSVDQALADLRCTRATSNVDAEGFPREGLLKDALAQVAASHTPSRRRRASTWRPPART